MLDQCTSFAVELVIADDCSQDETVVVARSYQQRQPQLFQVHTQECNVGTQRNYYDAFERSRGRYIAWLDADDYWTDPEKLQIQVEAMEAHPDVALCGHYVRWVTRGDQLEIQRKCYPEIAPGRHGLEAILRRNFLPSPSVLFLGRLHRKLPEWYFDVAPVTDWPLHILAAGVGDILMLDRSMADYTLNATSASWVRGRQLWYRSDADLYSRVENIVPRRFRRLIRSEKGKRYQALAWDCRQTGDFVESRLAAFRAFSAPAWINDFRPKSKTLVAALVREVQGRFASR